MVVLTDKDNANLGQNKTIRGFLFPHEANLQFSLLSIHMLAWCHNFRL